MPVAFYIDPKIFKNKNSTKKNHVSIIHFLKLIMNDNR